MLGSAGGGTRDAGSEDSVHRVSVGSCKSEDTLATTEDNDDSTTSHAQRRPLDAPVDEQPPSTFPHEVQCPTDQECENRCRPDVQFLDEDDVSDLKALVAPEKFGTLTSAPAGNCWEPLTSVVQGELCRF